MTPSTALAAAVRSALLPEGGRLLAVLGDPIAHSLSPALHGAALAAGGLPHRYIAIRCGADGVGELLETLRDLPVVLGVNLTAPLKEAALPFLDELAPLAQALGAVNTIARAPEDAHRLVGHNTDAAGYVRALREDTGFDPKGRTALLLGAGGAARAVAAGLIDAGAARVDVWARRPAQAARLAADLAALAVPPASLRAVATPSLDADLVVQCTPLGVGATPRDDAWAAATAVFDALPWGDWGDRVVASDLVYCPARPPFLARAAAGGCRTQNGLGMLVHQAAEAFRIWTGEDASLTAMRAALGEVV